MRIWKVLSALLLCLILAGAIACNPLGDEEEVSQQETEVARGNLTVSVSGSGNTVVTDKVRLAFGSGGKIDRIYADETDEVNKGDILAELDTDYLELALTQAQVALAGQEIAVSQAEVNKKYAEIALETAEDAWLDTVSAGTTVRRFEERLEWYLENDPEEVEKIREIEGDLEQAWNDFFRVASYSTDAKQVAVKEMELELAKQSVEQMKQALQQAQQALEQAQKNLGEATITAPFDGVVAGVYADEGDTVPAMTTIVYLIDLTSMELEVEVDEIDIAEVKLGQKTIIEVDALPALQLEGEIKSISTLSIDTGGLVLYKVIISLNASPDSGLKIGMSATADIIISERNNVLLVPDRAISQDSQGDPIVKVMANEEIEERSVVLGISDGFDTEIVDGLNEGDIVVVETKVKSSTTALF